MSDEAKVSFYFFPQKVASKTGKEELKDLSMEEEKQNCACQCHCTPISLPRITQNDADTLCSWPENIILNTRQQGTSWG